MSSTSITGNSGAPTTISRGPGNNRNQFVSLLDTHIVLSGQGTTSTGGGDPDPQSYRTIYMPSNLILPAERLTVLVSGKPALTVKNLDSDNNMISFVVFDFGYGGNYVFDYVVIDSVNDSFAEVITPI